MSRQVRVQRFSIVLLVLAAIFPGAKVGCAQTYAETTIHQLVDSEGLSPTNLIQAADGNFYGIATFGGLSATATPQTCPQATEGCGTIFKISSSGAYSVLYTFQGSTDGGYPLALLQGSDGNLYGVAAFGGNIPTPKECELGEYCTGYGTVFQISTAGVFKVLYSFDTTTTDGGFPNSLIQANDGNFYGTTYLGTIFKITPTGTLTTLYTFPGGAANGQVPTNGEYPAGIVQGSDGFLYGMTEAGGNSSACIGFGCGTIYKISLSGTFSTIYTFSGAQDGAEVRHGSSPRIIVSQPGHLMEMCPPLCVNSRSLSVLSNALTEGSDGNFYGTTPTVDLISYSSSDVRALTTVAATVFKITPSGTFSNLYTFNGASDGGGSYQSLLLAGNGNFYGTSGNTIFELTTSGTFSTIYITGTNSSVGSDLGGLIEGNDGLFYSEAQSGGNMTACSGDGCGTILTLSATPAIAPPIQLTLSSATSPLGSSATINWTVSNAFSLSMQQCYASVQNGATAAGTWNGLQSGTMSSGAFSGSAKLTPTHVGSYTYALTCGGVESGFATLTVPNPSITTPSSLPGGYISSSYSETLTANDGEAPYKWTVTGGTLPPGISLSSAGVLTGTPTTVGNYSFTIQASDSESPAVAVSESFSLVIAADFSLGESPSTLSIAQGQKGTITFTVTSLGGYNLPVTFSCSGLPSEATCSFSPTSVTPTAAGATSTLAITTTAPSAMIRPTRPFALNRYIGAMASLALLFGWSIGSRRKLLPRSFLLCLVGSLGLLLAMTGCGGGNASNANSPASNPGTPTGSSQVTINAVSTGTGATQHTVYLTVTITN